MCNRMSHGTSRGASDPRNPTGEALSQTRLSLYQTDSGQPVQPQLVLSVGLFIVAFKRCTLMCPMIHFCSSHPTWAFFQHFKWGTFEVLFETLSDLWYYLTTNISFSYFSASSAASLSSGQASALLSSIFLLHSVWV